MHIEIYYKVMCGVRWAYPVCHKAKLFLALSRNKKALHESDVKIIQELGFQIKEVDYIGG